MDKAQEFKDKAKKLMDKFKNPFTPKFKGQGHRLGVGEPSSNSRNSQNTRNFHSERTPSQSQYAKEKKKEFESENGRYLSQTSHSSPSTSIPYSNSNMSVKSQPAREDYRESKERILSQEKKQHDQISSNSFSNDDPSTSPCLSEPPSNSLKSTPVDDSSISNATTEDVQSAIAILLSEMPSNETLQVLIKLLSNILSNPQSEKFKRVRTSNPRIQNTICQSIGAVEFLLAIGFTISAELNPESSEEETWIVLDETSNERLDSIRHGLEALQNASLEAPDSINPSSSSRSNERNIEKSTPVKREIDRQIRVFSPSNENAASKIEIPNSFFQRTSVEVRSEAASRKQKMENEQMLTTRAWKEKQASSTNKRVYNNVIIRIQYPDGYVVQGTFLPSEPTSILYEFAASVLRDQFLEFDLLLPIPGLASIIPSSAVGSGKQNNSIPSLQQAQLVPASLLKFKLKSTNLNSNFHFTGLSELYLALAEPMTSVAIPPSMSTS